MLTSKKRRLEKALQFLERLATESKGGTPIIVEGQKDVGALHKLGVTGDMILAKTSRKSFLDVINEVKKRGKPEVIILMDFDRRGREGTKRLTQNFERLKIRTNLLFWNELRGLVGRDVKDIEGLASYIETLKNKK